MLECCSFDTARLRVREWHSPTPGDWRTRPLEDVVAAILTEPVTRALPEPWRGSYSLDRARGWIEERDAEGTTLLVIEIASSDPVGLVILFPVAIDRSSGTTDLHLGYLLAEESWGKGYASELVGGLVSWCRARPTISSITGGVEPDNLASIRVLEKNGFAPVGDQGEEQMYRVTV